MKVYLDNNATTKMDERALEAMMPFFRETYANASSIHSAGQEAKRYLDQARGKICDLLGVDMLEIVFTASGTESNNMALRGVAKAYEKRGRHIITTKIEHPAVKDTCKELEKQGYEVTYLDVDTNGVVDLNQLKGVIREDTILISVMHANNETGVVQPIGEIAKMANEKKIIFHVDAVQTTGKLEVKPKEIGIDLLTFSGHKFYGPKGVGGLYVKMGTRMTKILTGGHQERKRRPGTVNLPGIIGMAKAMEVAMDEREKHYKKEKELRDYFEDEILKTIPEIYINGKETERLPGTSSITFKYLEGESILLRLDFKGISVSSGSACAADDLKASHVLLAMGVPVEFAHGTIRFSLGKYNTKEEIDYVLEVLPPIIEQLRMMSPLWNEFQTSK